jgi:hypothetical protein
MDACRYCGRHDHNQWNCPVKQREDQQRRRDEQHQGRMEGEARAARQAAERAEREQRARRAENERHQRRVEKEAAAARRAAERVEERERERHEEQREREERYEESATKLHDMKRRASALRRSAGADPTRTWLEWRLLIAEARLLSPTSFHPAQQSEFTDFVDTLDEGAAASQNALGAANVQTMRSWVRLRRERGRWLTDIAEGLEALDEKGVDADNAPMSASAVDEQIAALRQELTTYEAQKPPPIPDHIVEHFRSTDSDDRKRILAELPGGKPSNEAAQQAWNYLGQTRQPTRSGARSPASTAAGTTVKWVVGIGAIFAGGALYSQDGPWAERLYVGAIAYSPVGGLGVVLAVMLAILSGRARRLEADDEARFDREHDQYTRAVVALVAWRDRVERLLKLGHKRERVLQRLAKTFREVDGFDSDPERGGHLQHFEQHRPDLEELVGKVSIFDREDEDDDERDDDDDGTADEMESELAALIREHGVDDDDDVE